MRISWSSPSFKIDLENYCILIHSECFKNYKVCLLKSKYFSLGLLFYILLKHPLWT